jgi:hypothetical protein
MWPKRPPRVGTLATVPQLVARYPAFSVTALRWLLFRRHSNGLASAVVKLGKRRVLIDVTAFDRWLEHHREGSDDGAGGGGGGGADATGRG